jgi:hypothetical protein
VPRYVWDVPTGTANATRGVAAQLGIRLTHLGPGRPVLGRKRHKRRTVASPRLGNMKPRLLTSGGN